MHREGVAALHQRHHCGIPLRGRPVPARGMEPQRVRQVAGYRPVAQVLRGNCARDGLGLLPKPFGLPCPLLAVGPFLGLALGEDGRVRGVVVTGRDASRRQNIPKTAIRFLAMGEKPVAAIS
jgi:hypothetical protein